MVARLKRDSDSFDCGQELSLTKVSTRNLPSAKAAHRNASGPVEYKNQDRG
jgi:hypothetical protein